MIVITFQASTQSYAHDGKHKSSESNSSMQVEPPGAVPASEQVGQQDSSWNDNPPSDRIYPSVCLLDSVGLLTEAAARRPAQEHKQ